MELPRQAALLLLNALASVIVDNIFILGCWQGAAITGGVVPKLSGLIDKSGQRRFTVKAICKNLTKFQFGCQLIQ